MLGRFALSPAMSFPRVTLTSAANGEGIAELRTEAALAAGLMAQVEGG